MESRLPKPKTTLSTSVSTTDITAIKMNVPKVTRNQNDLPQTSSTAMSNKLKKAKSTLNINLKATNENKPPPRETIVRSKTISSITRTATVAKAVKRPAAPANHGEAKRPLTRPAVRPIPTQRTGGNAITNRTVKNATNNKTEVGGPPKLPKWDLKGRLEYTTDELTSLKQKHLDLTTKYNEVQEKIDNIQNTEDMYKKKLAKFETTNENLNQELKQLKIELNQIQEEREDLSKKLKDSEELCEDLSNKLGHFTKKCCDQEKTITTLVSENGIFRSDLDVQRKVNLELNTVKDELQSLVHKMDKDRRVLHNAIQELKGNIRVFCRVRPKTASEAMKPLCAINFLDECTVEVGKMDGSDSVSCSGKLRGTKQEFSFDKVFPPSASQETIFEELALLVQSALEGYNVCVFAYGQTGSGKTYTMEGTPGLDSEGMIPRTVRHIFREMKQFELLGWVYRIEASFLEIYNEHIVDLLDSQSKSHEIRMADSKGSDLYVSNLKIEEIRSPEELHECLLTAQRNRAVAATQSNERSSRSHSVTRIRLIGTHTVKEEVSIGNLNLVDLAGSERLKNEESVRIAETKNINKSLANLGNVILALLKKQEHVPYRNSKLTHLLMPSLGGNSKTLMLLNISPLDECYSETLNSLRFASNVNSCKTGNVKRTKTVLQSST